MGSRSIVIYRQWSTSTAKELLSQVGKISHGVDGPTDRLHDLMNNLGVLGLLHLNSGVRLLLFEVSDLVALDGTLIFIKLVPLFVRSLGAQALAYVAILRGGVSARRLRMSMSALPMVRRLGLVSGSIIIDPLV
jgi:hypothetical protein